MNNNIIRAGIFFVAGLVLILFPEQVLNLQFKAMGWFLKRFDIKCSREKARRSNRIMAILFFVIAVVLGVVGVVW